ncbi:MAG TPA: PEGA domain-containing protein [Candidatus Angelobacter sp.]|jgi:hypothetical protein|nr:PEGA domain-containing protein [Candidatus Angelobacter sp.]
MKLLRIVAIVVGVFLVGSALGQSNSPQPASNPTQAGATHSQEKTPTQDTQSSLAASDSKSDSQSDEHHHRFHVRLGTIGVGAGYTRFSGPFFYNPFLFGFYPYSFGYSPFFYDPFFYSPFYSPGYYGGFSYSNGKGEVKLSGAPKTAEVYLNGGYAGVAGKLKSIWLEPGAYDLSVSSSGSGTFHQRIYVLSGKSLKIAVKPSQDK